MSSAQGGMGGGQPQGYGGYRGGQQSNPWQRGNSYGMQKPMSQFGQDPMQSRPWNGPQIGPGPGGSQMNSGLHQVQAPRFQPIGGEQEISDPYRAFTQPPRYQPSLGQDPAKGQDPYGYTSGGPNPGQPQGLQPQMSKPFTVQPQGFEDAANRGPSSMPQQTGDVVADQRAMDAYNNERFTNSGKLGTAPPAPIQQMPPMPTGQMQPGQGGWQYGPGFNGSRDSQFGWQPSMLPGAREYMFNQMWGIGNQMTPQQRQSIDPNNQLASVGGITGRQFNRNDWSY